MPDTCPLIPPAQVVRERLGQTVRETRMLRRLLDLAVKADEERSRTGAIAVDPRNFIKAAGQGVAN